MNIYIDDNTGEVSYEKQSLGNIIVFMWALGNVFPLGLFVFMAMGWNSI